MICVENGPVKGEKLAPPPRMVRSRWVIKLAKSLFYAVYIISK